MRNFRVLEERVHVETSLRVGRNDTCKTGEFFELVAVWRGKGNLRGGEARVKGDSGEVESERNDTFRLDWLVCLDRCSEVNRSCGYVIM